MMINTNYDVNMVVVVNKTEDFLFMKGMLDAMRGGKIVYNTIDDKQFFKTRLIEIQSSYKDYLAMIKTLQFAGYNLRPLSDEHYIIHELYKTESE